MTNGWSPTSSAPISNPITPAANACSTFTSGVGTSEDLLDLRDPRLLPLLPLLTLRPLDRPDRSDPATELCGTQQQYHNATQHNNAVRTRHRGDTKIVVFAAAAKESAAADGKTAACSVVSAGKIGANSRKTDPFQRPTTWPTTWPSAARRVAGAAAGRTPARGIFTPKKSYHRLTPGASRQRQAQNVNPEPLSPHTRRQHGAGVTRGVKVKSVSIH